MQVDTVNIAADTLFEHQLRPDDKISLSVWNHDDLSIGSLYGIYNSNEVYGKWILIDKAGEAAIPGIGKIKLGGLNTRQAADSVKKLLSIKVVNPVVVIKVLNLQTTILGEVKNPGTYLLEKEYHTLPELIGRAGGINYYGDVKHIKLIRTSGGIKKEFIVDLSKTETPGKPYPAIRPDDIIYVPPRGSQVFDKQIPSIIPIASLLSTIAVIITVLGK